ncbi:uncharacterized protein L203_102990 [Cryptococcus depauperatus CBS 7841]|uniref:Thioredoxin-like fold domain-containing protein n=1 Tax=Cryptococcus depauperatus CBS 7841 TaxID=1295531 RepID=A0AAJ8M0U9_9TREE
MSEPLAVPVDLVGQSALYNVPDPLLRRLRLQDAQGQDIKDLDKFFAEKEVLVLYAGSEYGANNLRPFHGDLTLFAQRYRTAAVIYISVDTDPLAPQRVLQGKPWLRMVFNDNSDFAIIGKGKGNEAEVEEVARGEDFVQGGDVEMELEQVQLGVEENQNDYVRPLSRAAVTVLMSVFSTPSVAIYHLKSHKFVAKNLKSTAFNPNKIDKTFDTWQKGGQPSLRVKDVLGALKWPLIGLLLAILYRLAVNVYGNNDNVLVRLIDEISWNHGGRGLGSQQ